MLIANRAYRAVGSWYAKFFLCLEDADFHFRLAWIGLETLYGSRISFTHAHNCAGSGTGLESQFSAARSHRIAPTLRFFFKLRSLAPTVEPCWAVDRPTLRRRISWSEHIGLGAG